MSKQPETKFKERVIKDFENHFGEDCYVIKTQERTRKGVLDTIICVKGNYVSIELKIDGEEPTKLQQININRVNRAGGLAFFTTPAKWDFQFAMIKEKYK